MSETRKVILITKLDRAAVDAAIAEDGVALIEPPEAEDCELEAVSGDYLFWEAELEIEEEEEED